MINKLFFFVEVQCTKDFLQELLRYFCLFADPPAEFVYFRRQMLCCQPGVFFRGLAGFMADEELCRPQADAAEDALDAEGVPEEMGVKVLADSGFIGGAADGAIVFGIPNHRSAGELLPAFNGAIPASGQLITNVSLYNVSSLAFGAYAITHANTIPTTGTYGVGDIVLKEENATILTWSGGPLDTMKYTLLGWRRITTGGNHVLNTDWVEMRVLTGQ